MTTYQRWERIGLFLVITAGLFALFTIEGIREGDNAGGIVMTVIPMVLCLAGWRYAVGRGARYTELDRARDRRARSR